MSHLSLLLRMYFWNGLMLLTKKCLSITAWVLVFFWNFRALVMEKVSKQPDLAFRGVWPKPQGLCSVKVKTSHVPSTLKLLNIASTPSQKTILKNLEQNGKLRMVGPYQKR